MTRRLAVAPLVALLLLLAACGDDEVTVSPGAGGSETDAPTGDGSDDDAPDDDMGDDPMVDPPMGEETGEPTDDFGDQFDTQQAIDDARSVLGMDEANLPDDVRIGRRGEEQMALTEDYVLGRRTVELDEDEPGSGFRVMSVTVELPDGPETYELEPS